MERIEKFISTENRLLYDILLDENVVGKENLESDFGISVGNKGEQQLKSKLLNESSDIISKLSSYGYEIRENSTPLYSGYCSFESFTNELDLNLIGIDDYYLLLSYSSNENIQLEIFDDLEDCLESCSYVLSNHLNYFEVELSNYEENKEYYEDSKSNGYGMSLEMEWNFPLPDFLFEKGIISKGRLLEIETIEENIESF
jgi:hypothetical protein